MRPVIVGIGVFVLVLAIACVFGGGFLTQAWTQCDQRHCNDSDMVLAGMIGQGLYNAGFVIALAGVGTLVAGIVARGDVEVTIPVSSPQRACPACGALGPTAHRFCGACGAPITPPARADIPRSAP